MKSIVEHRGKKRQSRGFSAAEVVEAKLSWTDAARMKIRMDSNRKSSYKANVKTLTELAKHITPTKKANKKTKAQRVANRKQPTAK